MPKFADPEDERGGGNDDYKVKCSGGIELPIKCVEHRLYIEELVSNFGDKELSDYDNADDGPEATTHLRLEDAVTGVECASIEHIPEVCPDEY